MVLVPVAAQSPRPEIHIDAGHCAAAVKLTARHARLRDVLEGLAQSLGFQLQFEGPADSVVNVSLSMPAPELVAKLSATDSVIVAQSRDPQCPSHNRIVKVWVLPRGKGHAIERVTTMQASSEQSRQFEAQSRQAKEAYQAYVLKHGEPPPGEEEEVHKPR